MDSYKKDNRGRDSTTVKKTKEGDILVAKSRRSRLGFDRISIFVLENKEQISGVQHWSNCSFQIRVGKQKTHTKF